MSLLLCYVLVPALPGVAVAKRKSPKAEKAGDTPLSGDALEKEAFRAFDALKSMEESRGGQVEPNLSIDDACPTDTVANKRLGARGYLKAKDDHSLEKTELAILDGARARLGHDDIFYVDNPADKAALEKLLKEESEFADTERRDSHHPTPQFTSLE